ncbi:MAG: hypothetical protein F6K19_09570 [Cyanothece sp. SIO1E1]|nr:hypothetical protein [Cyanothece sp. SIO1E1]
MSVIARRLSGPELTQRVLEMSKTGVYRESVFEALRPVATKKQIGAAIAHAKRFGLHSVASLRDAELGTYYELDLVKYRSSQSAISTTALFDGEDDLVKQMMHATLTIKMMLAIASSLTIGLTAMGAICLATGRSQTGLGIWLGAASAAGIWALQRTLAKQVLTP